MRHRRPPKRGGTTSGRTGKRASPGARRTGRHAGGCRDRTVQVAAGIGPEATGGHGRSRGDARLADTRCTCIRPPGRVRAGYPLLSGRARQRTRDGDAGRYVVPIVLAGGRSQSGNGATARSRGVFRGTRAGSDKAATGVTPAGGWQSAGVAITGTARPGMARKRRERQPLPCRPSSWCGAPLIAVSVPAPSGRVGHVSQHFHER